MYVIAADNLRTFLCKYKNESKLSSTSNIDNAFHFSTVSEAENYIENNMPKAIRKKYVVVKEVDIRKSEAQSGSFEWLNMQSTEHVEAFKHVEELIRKAPKYRKLIELKLQEAEDSLVDIYHFIEFNNLGTVDAYKIYKKEQELLQLRRRLKDELYCLDELDKHICSKEPDIHKYLSATDSTRERTYIPKVLVNLFVQDADNAEKDEN